MSEQEKQVETLQEGFVDVLTDIELAIISRQYDIAHNILRQAKKELQADLINKKVSSTAKSN